MATQIQYRVLTLKYREILDSVIYRLEKGWILHFGLDSSLTARNVRVFVNHPKDPKSGPNRHMYHELNWDNISSCKSDSYDNFAEIKMVMAGSFNYFFTIDGSDKKENANGHGYFLVDPILRIGSMDDRIPLDSIRCQSVLPKFLGKFDQWKDRLLVSKNSGYNMVHFTPVQELGLSNSAYCLKNQLKLNPDLAENKTMDDLKELIVFMKDKWDMLSLTDLVFNHTANESPWVLEHPECAYNVLNSPHLKPAYVLDRILWHFSLDVADGKWSMEGIPRELGEEYQLGNIKRVLLEKVIPQYKLWEFFQTDVEDIIIEFKSVILEGVRADDRPFVDLVLVPHKNYLRNKCHINLPQAVKNYYTSQPNYISRGDKIQNACDGLRQRLYQLNEYAYNTTWEHLNCAVDSFVANGRWRFINPEGPRIEKVGPDDPIMWNYFTLPKEKMSIEKEEEAMNSSAGAYCMAHNGWIMSDDPLRNFAEPGSNVYFRRELIPWGDCVKLRYGNTPNDCPFLWSYIKSYVCLMAEIFHGVRLDNCHSTPIHVAEYMLDEARKIRPDLYVIAELFTNSEYLDNIFINSLGLNSLIREGLNAWDAKELSRFVYRHGGHPVGSFIQLPSRPLMPSSAHAIFMDQTHDNESPITKQSGFNVVPYSSIIAMTCSATGSNRGYDEMVPHYIDVVKEKRLYKSWMDDQTIKDGYVNKSTGIIHAKFAINHLHHFLSKSGFEQVFVDVLNENVVAITRHNPLNHNSVVMYANTAFKYPSNMDGNFFPIDIEGVIEEVIFEIKTVKKNGDFKQDPKFINGLVDYEITVVENIKPENSKFFRILKSDSAETTKIQFNNLTPGSVIAFKVNLSPKIRSSLLSLRHLLVQFGYRMRTFSARNISEIVGGPLEQVLVKMTLNDLNRLLFRVDNEEKDEGLGFGVYNLPNFGNLTYCGLQGLVSILSEIRAHNDLGHPICENLRNGNWLMDYTTNRIKASQATNMIGVWLEQAFTHLNNAPRYLIPSYFDALITGVFNIAEEVCWAKMSLFIANGSTFVRSLSLGSIQMCSYNRTGKLAKLSKNLAAPKPPKIIENEKEVEMAVSISAGLPHFASGLFRNWGRDTFIALRGLLLITGRFEDARYVILSYAGCLRHGLIPNLLGEGTSARYNCRDAVWFWLQCIKDYCTIVPKGVEIFNDAVARLYPDDDSHARFDVDQKLHEVMQEALQKHATGLKFRERDAGSNIDMHMVDEGFNNNIGVDWKTGFVYGGNKHNCGTWMDKMGSSVKAGNKGVPATPRDGSAIEIVGLCASVVNWLAKMNKNNSYPHKGVKKIDETYVSFSEWYNLIKDNFDKYFFIANKIDNLVNHVGIYKDTVNSQIHYTDFQFRPNFTIALAVCPDLVNVKNAWSALKMAQKHLLGPLGMKTLDKSDWNYVGDYNNSDDSNEFKKAQGFNYHQGPEWVWPIGFFFRAKLFAAEKMGPEVLKETIDFIKLTMTEHNMHLTRSSWKSLPELTNSNGKHCADSCEAQAWSVACLLETLYDLEQILNS